MILQGVSRIRLLEIGGQRSVHDRTRAGAARCARHRRRARRAGDEPQGRRQAGHQADARAAQGGERAGRQRRPSRASSPTSSPRNLDVQVDEKQDVLETFDLKTRLRKVLQFLSRQHEVLKVREKINSQVQEEMGRNQRESVLRQQLKAIKEELGEIDETRGDLDDFRREDRGRQDAGRRPRRSARKQLERLKVMAAVVGRVHRHAHLPRVAGRAAVVEATEDRLDIQAGARHPRHRPLRPREGEEAHPRVPGGAQAQAPTRRGRSSASSGRPASARRRSGESIARSLGRKFIRISLGGVRDEAEIRGHRRTYVGALPGRIIQGMKKAGSNNPVFMLDEIDKLGADFRGDPVGGAARGARPRAEPDLLRPLPRGAVRPVEGHVHRDGEHAGPDPAGAARPHGGAGAARLHARGEAGRSRSGTWCRSSSTSTASTSETGRAVSTTRRSPRSSSSYTREAGVRNLEREIANVIRAVAVQVAEGKAQPQRGVTPSAIAEFLGPQKYISEVGGADRGAGRRDRPRLDAGRRRHPVHRGDQDDRQGQLVLTGQLGDVMKESAQAALSFIRARAEWLGIEDELPREDRHPRPHPGGRDPEGRPVGGRRPCSWRWRRC